MTDPDHNESPHHPSGLLREVGLLVRYRRLVLGIVLVATAAAVVYSLVTPKQFRAHTSLLPAEEAGSSFGGLMNLINQLPIQGANLPGVTTTTDLLAGMLQSRRLQDPVIEEFGFQERYGAETLDETRDTFSQRLSASVGDEGILHVYFTDEDPEIAARVVNRMIELLDDYNVNVRKTRSRLNREFVQRRLDETRMELAAAEDRLKSYQEEHAVALSPEEMAAAEAVGELMARKFALEIEIDALRRTMGDDAPQIARRRHTLEALEHKIAALPELGLVAVRFYRDIKVQEQLFVYLSAQVEQARIEEQRDLPVIQVLDRADAPEIRDWPRRKLIVIVAAGLAAVVSVLVVHAIDFYRRERETLRQLTAAPES